MSSISGLDDIQATSQYQPPETLASAGNQPSTTPTAAAASGQPTAAQPQPTTNQPPPPVEPEQRESLCVFVLQHSNFINSEVPCICCSRKFYCTQTPHVHVCT